ncbi:hypothetical protein ES708_23941 [subsurface metagenome]
MAIDFNLFDPAGICFELDRQVHALKHFSKIDREYFEKITLEGNCSASEIKDQLTGSGSKFYPEFVKNPLELMNKLELKDQFTVIHEEQDPERLEFQLEFRKGSYPNGIGADVMFLCDKIKDPAEIRYEEINGISIRVVKGTPKPTWRMNLILHKSEEFISVNTIFPGLYAPPFPNSEEQTREQYVVCKKFWDEHGFIIS